MSPEEVARQLRARAESDPFAAPVDKEVLVTKAWLDEQLQADSEAVEQHVLPALDALVLRVLETSGWFTPPTDRPLAAEMQSIRGMATKLGYFYNRGYQGNAIMGNRALKARFGSFWEAANGPALRAFDREARLKVLRYRLGLNAKRETFDVSLAAIRRGFVVGGHAVSFFKPVVAAQVYARWLHGVDQPVTVWDPSGGFGARMLGFFSVFPQGTYIANEPAQKTRRDLLRLAEEIQAGTPALSPTVHVREEGSELRGPEQAVDLVFTSPPYFDKERYFAEPGQCWRDHPTLDAWAENYLRPTLDHAHRWLRAEGRLVLNVDRKLRDLVIETAGEAGFALDEEEHLVLQRSHFERKAGYTKAKTEPVLVFTKVGAERWRWLRGSAGRYEVSDQGRIRSWTRKRPRILEGTVMAGGYRAVGVTYAQGARGRTELIHRLVAAHFCEETRKKGHTDVRHLNGDKLDNRAVNLAWGTRSENMRDVVQHRRARLTNAFPPVHPSPGRAREWYSGRTTDEGLVQTCLALIDEGLITTPVMARILDCSNEVASNIVTGRTHRNITGRPRTVRQPKRSPAQVGYIIEAIRGGLTREEVNEKLGETLNHQAFYYYKKKANL